MQADLGDRPGHRLQRLIEPVDVKSRRARRLRIRLDSCFQHLNIVPAPRCTAFTSHPRRVPGSGAPSVSWPSEVSAHQASYRNETRSHERRGRMSTYRFEEGTAHIALDEGKVNAAGSATLLQLDEHLSQALLDGASAVVLTGRPGMFSAGFDLTELRSGDAAQTHLRRTLIDLVLRLFEFERPVVIACTGHAMAAGAALLLAADRRIGVDGSFKLGFNEVTMGASISAATVELARYRMPMPWFESLISGETFPPRIARTGRALGRGRRDRHRPRRESAARCRCTWEHCRRGIPDHAASSTGGGRRSHSARTLPPLGLGQSERGQPRELTVVGEGSLPVNRHPFVRYFLTLTHVALRPHQSSWRNLSRMDRHSRQI